MSEFNVIYIIIAIVFSCFICTCSYLCKSSGNPHSVIATTTHTTEVYTTPQQYPNHPTAVPGPCQSYQGVPYQPVPVQPGDTAQPGNPAEPTSPNNAQQFIPGQPPSYQDATGPAYSLQPMPSSQPVYLLSHLAQPQPNALPDSTDFLAHSAYSPEFVLS